MLFRPRVGLKRQPSQERASFTLQVILEAAERIVLKEGIEAFKMARLAEVAGVGVGTLYEYFPDRSAVLVALLELHSQSVLAELTSISRSTPPLDVDQKLTAMTEALVAAIYRHRSLKQLVYHTLEHESATAMLDMMPEFVECMAQALESHLPPERIPVISQLMVFAADGLMEGVIRRDSVLTDPKVMTAAVRAIWLTLATAQDLFAT